MVGITAPFEREGAPSARASARARLPRDCRWRSAARVSDSRTRVRACVQIRACMCVRACCARLRHSRWAWRMRLQTAAARRCNVATGQVPVRTWQGSAQSQCRCGRDERSPGADVGGGGPSPGIRWDIDVRTATLLSRKIVCEKSEIVGLSLSSCGRLVPQRGITAVWVLGGHGTRRLATGSATGPLGVFGVLRVLRVRGHTGTLGVL